MVVLREVHIAAEIDGRHVARRLPVKDPGRPSDLACCKQANACRKLGLGGKTETPVAALPSDPLRASQEAKKVRTHRWKALRARKAAALACRVWKGSLVPLKTRSAMEAK